MPKPPSLGAVTSPFGMRYHPITGVYRMHYGEDTIGEGNFAPVTGTVIFAGYDTSGMGFGNAVGIKADATGDVWWTAHHASLNVAAGQRVIERATYLGLKGQTGAAVGIHAHQECRRGGTVRPGSGVAVNPRPFYTATTGGGGIEPIDPHAPTKRDNDMTTLYHVNLASSTILNLSPEILAEMSAQGITLVAGNVFALCGDNCVPLFTQGNSLANAWVEVHGGARQASIELTVGTFNSFVGRYLRYAQMGASGVTPGGGTPAIDYSKIATPEQVAAVETAVDNIKVPTKGTINLT